MDKSDSGDYCRVLFINFGGIGDEILFFPTIKDFKEENPDCDIDVLMEPRSASSRSLTNLIDDVIEYDVKSANKLFAFLKIVQLIRKGHYDIVISSGSNPLIALMLFFGGSKIKIGYDNGLISKKLLTKAVPLNKNQYAAAMYHDLLKGIGINKETPLPEVLVSVDNLVVAKEILGKYELPRIMIHPGVSKLSIQKGIQKSWPEKNWYDLICRLLENDTCEVILAGGPDDEDVISNILDLLEKNSIDKSNLINLYGKTKNLAELAAVMKECDLLLCVDSAPMHIGVGLNKKLVAYFSSTDPAKLLPDHPHFKSLKIDDTTCLPCRLDDKNETCEETYCLDITVDQMYSAIEEMGIL